MLMFCFEEYVLKLLNDIDNAFHLVTSCLVLTAFLPFTFDGIGETIFWSADIGMGDVGATMLNYQAHISIHSKDTI